MDAMQVLPITIDILLIILLVVGIIIGIKLIIVMNKVDKIVDNVEQKVNALNGVFNFVNAISDRIEIVINKSIEFISKIFTKASSKGKVKEDA